MRELRAQYGNYRGSQSAAVARLRVSLLWRVRNTELLWNWAFGGRRWSRFVGFMRNSGLRFPVLYAGLSPLPAIVRRHLHLGVVRHGSTLVELLRVQRAVRDGAFGQKPTATTAGDSE
jgi:hypothetical protein